MANLFETGADYLAKVRSEHMASEVSYCRGEDGVSILAAVGSSTSERVDSEGSIVEVNSRDFIVKAADLVIDGVTILPQVGDFIVDSYGRYWWVLPSTAEKAYEECDLAGVSLRIRTKYKVAGD